MKYMRDEFLRKSVHFSSLIYPICYYFLFTKKEMIFITLIISIFLVILDLLRMNNSNIQNLFNKLFHLILRDNEKIGALSGATFFMIGAFLTILLFNKSIAIASLFVLVISDTAAAIFGQLIPSKKIFGNKSVAGSISFLLSSIIIVLIFKMPILIVACITTTIVELYAKILKVDDNILIPLSFGLMGTLLIYL